MWRKSKEPLVASCQGFAPIDVTKFTKLKYNSVIFYIMEIEVTPKKWGSSMGVIIPSEIVEAEKIKENKKIIIEIKKERTKAKEIWGLGKHIRKSGQEIKDEMRKGWD